ncbi:MAG: thermonuclease family protein [Proteobacteria bacterium]|nr:thermonuclease family protein [Pseudomonadota bacterium]
MEDAKMNMRQKAARTACVIVILVMAMVLGVYVFAHATESASNIFNGYVIKIADGDTMTVRNRQGESIKIRYAGIDAPEIDQPHGEAAGAFLSRLLLGKTVQVEILDIDRYNRVVGLVEYEGIDVNELLVQQGHAWVFQRYCKQSFCESWIDLELHARNERKGLWGEEPAPVEPWNWRQGQRVADERPEPSPTPPFGLEGAADLAKSVIGLIRGAAGN